MKQLLNNTAMTGFVLNRCMEAGFTANALRTNDLLRKDQWEHFDAVVVEIARKRLVGIGDLLQRDLRYPVPEALGRTEIRWEKSSDMDPADRSMEGISKGKNDRVDFATNVLPFFITHKDFHISLRHLRASEKYGDALDTTQAEVAARLVSESLEDTLFNGAPEIKLNGNAVAGYTTHANRNTGNFESTGGAWTGGSKTGELILADVISMVAAAHADRMFGPYVLYVPSAYWTVLQKDFKAGSDKSTLQRVKEVQGIEDVKVADVLPANNVVLVQMTRDVVDLADGEEITTVQWDSAGGFLVNFKVMAIQVPRIKADHSGRSGIVHFTPA